MNQTELTIYSQWLERVDQWQRPSTGLSVHDIVKPGLVLFYWFKAGVTTLGAAQLAIANRERPDHAVILQEAKAMYRTSQKRVIATGATGPDLPSSQRPTNPCFDEDDTAVLGILSSMPVTERNQ